MDQIYSVSIMDNKTIFYYVVVFISIMYLFNFFEIKLNILFGFIVSCIVLYVLYKHYRNNQEEENKIYAYEKELIYPKSDKIVKYDKISEFLFTIQDFYIINPQAYAEFIQNIENFLTMYEDIKDNKPSVYLMYQNLLDTRRKILNSLQSLTYNFPENKEYLKKLDTSLNNFDEIINVYVEEIRIIHENCLHNHGYNVNTKLYNDKFIPYNSFNKYEIF